MLPQSKIFDEYAKLAIDQGIVKPAPMVKEAAEDDTAKSIALLYGVKPNGKEDDKNMIEKAHPDPIAVARSYDAMNAIVEDEILRHDIMTWIAEKVPNGQLTMKRYVAAHNALLKSLVNIGFTTDNADQDGLRKLADSCTEQLTKEAFGWGAAARWGIPALLGLIALLQHTPDLAVSVTNNAQSVLDQISDMKGEMYLDDIEQTVNKLKVDSDHWQKAAYVGGQLRSAIQQNPEYEKKIHDYAANIVSMPMASLPMPVRSTADYLISLGEVLQKMPEWKMRVKMFTPSGSDWGPVVDKLRWALSPILPNDQAQLLNALSGLEKAVKAEQRKISTIVASSSILGKPQAKEEGGAMQLTPYSPAVAAAQIIDIGKDG